MTTTALLFFLLSVVVVWGGLAVSIARLRADTRREAPEPDEPHVGPDL